MEVNYHPLLNFYGDARLKGGNKSLKLDGHGINADLDGRENVGAVSPCVSGFRNGSRFILKKDFGAGCSVTRWICNFPTNGS
jgi:hypothetical protein